MSFFGGMGSGLAGIYSAQGSRNMASAYNQAALYAEQNAIIAKTSEAIQNRQNDRKIFQVISGQQADIAGAGMANSGSARMLLMDSAEQGGLAHATVAAQGQIEQQSYAQQADMYRKMAKSAKTSATGSIIGAAFSFLDAGSSLMGD